MITSNLYSNLLKNNKITINNIRNNRKYFLIKIYRVKNLKLQKYKHKVNLQILKIIYQIL